MKSRTMHCFNAYIFQKYIPGLQSPEWLTSAVLLFNNIHGLCPPCYYQRNGAPQKGVLVFRLQ